MSPAAIRAPRRYAALLLAAVVFGAGCARPMPDSALVGYAAPNFQLENLAGNEVSLANHRGEVVILDFWATWCGPCRQAMPTISDVARKYAGQGVVLYAVNLQEDPDTIRSFINESGLNVNVLLDTDGAVADAYGADAIPQTVLIDQDGTVQAIHVGLTSDLEEQLSSQIEALVSGERLAMVAAPIRAGR